jgi:hypothetical protein
MYVIYMEKKKRRNKYNYIYNKEKIEYIFNTNYKLEIKDSLIITPTDI